MKMYPENDFYSFHYHNGWAFLNNRFDTDIMSAAFRSYFNPVLDSINFLLIRHFNTRPNLFLFITGFKLGAFLFMCYMFFCRFFTAKGTTKTVCVIFAFLFVLYSPLIFMTLSFEWNDLQTGTILLIAFYLYFDNIFCKDSKKRTLLLFAAAMISGMAAGLKNNLIFYPLSLIFVSLFCSKNILSSRKTVLILILGAALGFLTTDGFWLLKIYNRFSNPVFPYFNNIFHSHYGIPFQLLNLDLKHLLPDSLQALILLPFANTTQANALSFFGFFDLKIPLSAIIVILYLFLRNHSFKFCKNISKIINIKTADMFVFITIFIFVLNATLFAQGRVLHALIPISCILIVAFSYAFSQWLKKINMNICLIIFLLSVIGFFKFSYYVKTQIIAISILFIAFILLLFIYFNKNIQNKKFYITLLTLVFIFSGVTRFVDSLCGEKDFAPETILDIEKADIKDNSTVLVTNVFSGFVVPKQNKNAKYVFFALPPQFFIQKFNEDKERDLFVEYTSKYLCDLILDIFNKKEENVYIIVPSDTSESGFDLTQNIYFNPILSYYPDADGHNCSQINYRIFEGTNLHGEYWICKLK